MENNIDSEEESILIPENLQPPRRFARNPRREGYERDNVYVGTTSADIVRLEAARAAEPEVESADEGAFHSAVERLFYCEGCLNEADLENPRVVALLEAAHTAIAAAVRLRGDY